MRKGLAACFFSLMGMYAIYAIYLTKTSNEPSKIAPIIILIISIALGIYFYIRDRKDKRGSQWPKRK